MAVNQKSSTARDAAMDPVVQPSTATVKYFVPNATGNIIGDNNRGTIIGHISG
jgi:hypothetical protein